MLDVWLKTGSIFLLIFLGALTRRRGLMDARFTRQLAAMLTSVFYPALIFSSIVREFTLPDLLGHWALPSGSALIMVLGALIGLTVTRLTRWADARQLRTFQFQCTMNNYSFLPMLLALLFWDQRGLALVVYSTLGAEVVIWTLGTYTLSGDSLGLRSLKYLLNMPLLALAAAAGTLALTAAFQSLDPALPTAIPEAVGGMVLETLRILGAATIPVATLIAGSRMAGLHPSHYVTKPALGLVVMRLAVIPAAAVGILHLLPFPDLTRQVLLIVAIMPCAITSVTLCEVFDGDSDFAAATVLITHIAALVTIPLWLSFLL
ncbi:MAG: AEC family transporter [Verrucomicrobiota bacterium]